VSVEGLQSGRGCIAKTYNLIVILETKKKKEKKTIGDCEQRVKTFNRAQTNWFNCSALQTASCRIVSIIEIFIYHFSTLPSLRY